VKEAPLFEIVIPIYREVDLMDVAAPVEMFSWMAELWEARKAKVVLAAESLHPIRTRDGLTLTPDATFDDFRECGRQAQLIWVPGGNVSALNRLMEGGSYLDFLVAQADRADYVCSVCEGAMLLAAAGLLDGYCATTHWAFIPCFAAFPEIHVAEGFPRYVIDRNRVTGGGISSGLDEALAVVALLAGDDIAKSVQMTTQYFPEPPFSQTIVPATACPLDLGGAN